VQSARRGFDITNFVFSIPIYRFDARVSAGVSAIKRKVVIMIKTTLIIDGMMCSMCESHVNDTIRQHFKINKVTSSHSKGVTEIISENPLDETALKEAVGKTGYKVPEIKTEPYEKKRFSLFGRK
jgi:copper chaperone CopZ